jgi:hypothetical protein
MALKHRPATIGDVIERMLTAGFQPTSIQDKLSHPGTFQRPTKVVRFLARYRFNRFQKPTTTRN